nr:hypothetical protein [uncultured Cupriavidus sp.]
MDPNLNDGCNLSIRTSTHTSNRTSNPCAKRRALLQLEKVSGGMAVLTVAVAHASAPEFSNEGAALILRLLRQESARALAVLVPDPPTPDTGAQP